MGQRDIPKTNVIFGKGSEFYDIQQGAIDWNDKEALRKVASANPTTKQYTNGKWNVGMSAALASGALGTFANYTQALYQSKAYSAQAAAYDQQVAMNYMAYRYNMKYLGEQNFWEVANLFDEEYAFEGEQIATIAASGYDMSAGEQRVIADTRDNKYGHRIYLQNRGAYLQSIEAYKETMMEANRLLAAAAMARRQAKYARRLSRVALVAGAVNTAAGVMNAAYGPKLATKA